MNVIVEDFDASVAHMRKVFGADFLLDLPSKEWQACLMECGRVIFEIFAPHAFLLNARYGANHLGIEYQANMDEVRATIAAHNIRIMRDIKVAVHTHPADCYGISFEFYEGYFHDWDWPLLGGGKMKSAEYWRDTHPLGLTGLKGYTVAVADMAAALKFFQSFLDCKVAYEAPRAAITGRAVGLQIADAVLELLTPVGEGALQRHLYRYGDGIRSTVFGVRDVAQAKRYFNEQGIDLVPGGAPHAFALPPEANLGLLFEFSE
jgi:catechol 2,3-dioxygenase-like lactoylglutathione lyase family enzyme